jgi:hypothetical protein
MTLLTDEYLNELMGENDPKTQGSAAWLAERVGHVTCSRFADVMDVTQSGKPGAKRNNYLLEVVAERLTGNAIAHYVNAAMEHGTQQEPHARMAYEAATGRMVVEQGFLHHKTIKWVGGSPDGLVGEGGGCEFKCPTSQTHIKTLLSGECLYLPQIMGLMWITGRQWFDYVSYDPRLPAGLQLFIKRIPRDDDYIAELAGNVLQFLSEVADMVEQLGKLKTNAEPAPEPTAPEWNKPVDMDRLHANIDLLGNAI